MNLQNMFNNDLVLGYGPSQEKDDLVRLVLAWFTYGGAGREREGGKCIYRHIRTHTCIYIYACIDARRAP